VDTRAMTLEIRADAVDVEAVVAAIRKRIAEKRKGLASDEEIHEMAENRLDAVLDAHEFNIDFIVDCRAQPPRWNYAFGADTVYESSRGLLGRLLRIVRRVLRPVQKLVWNPDPMISALARQSDLNACYVQLLRSLSRDVARLKRESEQLQARVCELHERLTDAERRETTLPSH
jgi:hypothetical protein